MLSIVIEPKWLFYSRIWILDCLRQVSCRCCSWVELPVQRRLYPIFLKWRRVTRHPLVFRGLTGSQRTPGFGASHSLSPSQIRFCPMHKCAILRPHLVLFIYLSVRPCLAYTQIQFLIFLNFGFYFTFYLSFNSLLHLSLFYY